MSEEPSQWNIQSILHWTTQYFLEKKISSARLDAELLLGSILGYTRLQLYQYFDQPLKKSEQEQYREMIKARVAHKPVAYLIKQKAFWSLDLEIQEGVLIPRPETELVVEVALESIRKWQKDHPYQTCWIMEMGIGSGAIALALCSELENLQIVASDRSAIALATTQINLHKYQRLLEPKKNALFLVQGDRFSMFAQASQFDFILSNPPYISPKEISFLPSEIQNYEPKLALDGGKNGLEFYHYFSKEVPLLLGKNGELIAEIGWNQKQATAVLFDTPSWRKLSYHNDLQGIPRVLHAVANGLE